MRYDLGDAPDVSDAARRETSAAKQFIPLGARATPMF